MPGGGELALFKLVCHLDPQRYVPVVLLFTDGPLLHQFRDAGFETHVLPLAPELARARKDDLGARWILRASRLFEVLKFTRRLTRFIKKEQPDIVYCNSLKSDLLGGIAARIARVPVIWHVRDRIADDYLPPRVASFFRWMCYRVPDCVVANSRATLRTLRSDNGTVLSNAHVIHGGVQVGPHEPHSCGGDSEPNMGDGTAGVSPAACPLQQEAAPPLVGLVGRIAPWKGQHVFLRAAARVALRFPKARFQVIGSSLFDEASYEREVRELARELGIAERVEFTGFCTDPGSLISKLDVLVHASTTGEPFGQVIIEGMAAGKPVVATDGGGVPEIVVPGHTGLLVPMGDPDAMALAIESLLADPASARVMGLRGWQRARDRFTLEIVAGRVQDVCDGLLFRAANSQMKHARRLKEARPGSIVFANADGNDLVLATAGAPVDAINHDHAPAQSAVSVQEKCHE
jgi:glycosyltransferase involved in cell wall biosynthesis